MLSVKDGTEFDTYSTMIYVTYLEWYGVLNKTTIKSGTESVSNFNEEIFDTTSDVLTVDPSDITEMLSKEDLESEVLNMSYLMLSPEAGREYRKSLVYNGIADFLYEQYNRIVYGGSSSVYSGTATKSNSGFLAVPSFSENFLTSWFINEYVDIAVILIMVCMIILIVFGLLKSRKISWFILGAFTIVNVILLVPSSGEITPAVTTNFTQKIFSSKMTFWTLSEGVTNASIENDAATTSNSFSELSSEEASIVSSLINTLSVVYTDRSLMLKQDTSQKITQGVKSDAYTNAQSLQSARWILPMIMQQFSADDRHENDFVYVKLSNVWDDASNLYWYYNPDDAINVTKPTKTSSQFADSNAHTYKESTGNNGNRYNGTTGCNIASAYYTDYKDCSSNVDDSLSNDKTTNINYANYSYTLHDNNDDNVHLYSYILHDNTLNFNNTSLQRKNIFGNNFENYSDADSWQKFIDTANNVLTAGTWSTNKSGAYSYETISDEYDRNDVSTLQDGYSYYKTTESPYYYFFNVVKDQLPTEKTIGALIGRLQGEIETLEDGTEVRNNFMYATITADKEVEDGNNIRVANSDVQYTGYVRDVLDLQQMFTNTIPYMYEMTLISGGFDGKSGVLADSVMTDESNYYEGNDQSWAYRCNWAVKLMENNNFSKPEKAKLADGTSVTIQNPMLPECYEAAGRKMVFSEAQKMA